MKPISAASTVKLRRVKGDTGENLIGLLERSLDGRVYRAKFSSADRFLSCGHSLNHVATQSERQEG